MRNGFLAYPRADRWHKHPTALLGGISIYLSCLIPALFIKIPDQRILGLFIGSTFLFSVGLADDKFHFKPYTKLFCQIIAGSVVVAYGVILGLPKESFFSIPLTLVWIVLVTNSFNLLDNIDGLSAGIAGISAFMLFLSSTVFPFNPLGLYGLILAGASFGFLPRQTQTEIAHFIQSNIGFCFDFSKSIFSHVNSLSISSTNSKAFLAIFLTPLL